LSTPNTVANYAAGDKRGGSTHVLYDTTYSRRGALMPVARAPRASNPFDIGLSVMIKNPHALPMYREDPGRKRGREKSRNVSTPAWLVLYISDTHCVSGKICSGVNCIPLQIIAVNTSLL
jgi:hypothetical protein